MDILPYLEFIARPRSEIIFLIQSDDNRYPWWLEHASTVTSAAEHCVSIDTLEKALTQRRRVFMAEDRIAAAREIFAGKGVIVRVESYSGSLKKVARSYQGKPDEITILVNSEVRQPRRFLIALRQLFGRAVPQPAPAILLLQPNRHF